MRRAADRIAGPVEAADRFVRKRRQSAKCVRGVLGPYRPSLMGSHALLGFGVGLQHPEVALVPGQLGFLAHQLGLQLGGVAQGRLQNGL